MISTGSTCEALRAGNQPATHVVSNAKVTAMM
jgi:hypothetical protein